MGTAYQIRRAFPAYLERGVVNTTSLPVWYGSAAVAPTSGTYSLYDSAGEAIVSAQSVTVTNDVATYTLTPADTRALGEGYREEWALVLAGETHYFRSPAALVRRQLYSVVTNGDLLARHPELANFYPAGQTSWQPQIYEYGHKTVMRRIIAAGKRPYLVTSPDAFYEPELFWTLAGIFRLSSTTSTVGPSKYAELADRYEAKAEAAWASVRMEYDEDHDGDTDSTGQPAVGVIYTSNPPPYWGVR